MFTGVFKDSGSGRQCISVKYQSVVSIIMEEPETVNVYFYGIVAHLSFYYIFCG